MVMKSRQERVLTYLNPLYQESKETKKQFSEWYGSAKIIQIRYVSILTGILYIIASQIDKSIAPASILPVMIFFHLYVLPISLFFIAAITFRKKFNKLMHVLLLIAPIGAALANMFIVLNLKEFSIYLPEIYLIIIWTFAVSGLRLSYATISATITSASVLIINAYLFPMAEDVFTMHCLWMLSAFSFGLLTAFILEKSYKIIFLNDKRLEQLATIDKLTNLYNRFKIEEFVEIEIHRAQRYSSELSVVLLDIDDFKSVNDTYGHHVGDIVLKEFSRILENEVRKVDMVGRWGGEEFLILLPETNIKEAKKVAEHLREKIESFKFTMIDKKTSSFGVSQYQEDDTVERIINRADRALYKAKNSGKNRVEVF